MEEFKEHKIEWNDEKVGRLWNYYSKTHPYNSNYFSQGSGGHVVKLFKNNSEQIFNPLIVDFGGGKGFMFEHCKEELKDFRYYNLDFSKDSTIAAKQRLKHHEEFVDSIYIEALPTSLEDSSVDIVFLIEVLEHLNDEYLKSTLTEIQRILKPGGKLVLTTPNNEDLELSNNFCPDCGSIYHKWQHVKSINKNSIRDILTSFHYIDIKVFEKNLTKEKNYFIRVLKFIKYTLKKQKYVNLICIASKK